MPEQYSTRTSVSLLGTVEVWRAADGCAPAEILPGGLRLRGLLAQLALDSGRPVTAESLIDDLWGEQPPDSVGNALQSLVSRLRRALGTELVATVPGGYRLQVAPEDVDAVRFVRLIGSAAAEPDPRRGRELLTAALGLWRGPALADLRRLPFADPAADRLAEQRATAAERLAALSLSLGEPTVGLDVLSELLAGQPLRESAAVALARGLHAAGRQADALAVLDHTRELLAEQLGVDPGPELAQTRLDVLRGTPPAPPPRPPAVARPGRAALTSFVGRDDDVSRVRGLLTSARLVTLTGPGGAGKTRLAREVAADLGGETRLAELAALTGPDQLPATLLAALGGPELVIHSQEEIGPDTTERLRAAVAGRDLVLVLDNCEHLVDAVATLTQTLLETSPRLRVLATSREPLAIPGEMLHPVDALAPAAARRLFADRAAAVAPGFALDDAVRPAVAEICRRLDGQPLPIELAAARLRTLSPHEIATRLDDRFRLLTAGARTALPRHQTLRAVVDWSWELLSKPERVLARRLAVFTGGATEAAVERVCTGPDGPALGEVLDLLAALVDKSLVVAVPQPGGTPTRYRMLETIREYAREQLDTAGERDAVAAAHAAFLVELVEQVEPQLRGAGQLEWLAQLRVESDNITEALQHAVEAGDAPTAHRLTAAMWWSWLIRGLFDEAMRWVEAVCALPGAAPADVRARNTAYLALTCAARGDLPAALRCVETATGLAANLPAPRHPVLDLIEPITALYAEQDEGPVSRLSEEADDPWLRGMALLTRAQVAENRGDIEAQRSLIRAAHTRFAAVGDRFGLGLTLGSLGELEDIAGDLDAAARAYDEAIALATELGNDDDLPQFLVHRARLAARRGDLDAARAELTAAAAVGSGPFGNAGAVPVMLAEVERLAGRFEAARAQLELAATDLAESGLGVPQRRAYLAAAHAAVELTARDIAAGRARLAEAVAAAVESRDGPVTAMVAELAARFALRETDAATAGLLLGVAAAQRGTLDRGNPEVLAALDEVRDALGPAAADEAVERGRALPRTEGLALLQAFIPRVAVFPSASRGVSATESG
ncbi:BTAD domain-containing putative transcriptional regulator [Pseudonocardia asaccharolytica]|uniref:SARP family transcriptional regulator n=1 Tax=Pseudonocardia asaccharolytica DSM 44247 = NBRC 16224 TaxID=1123024 RepID=A0A511D2N6_9PSEU|nr:BTAD domain-containing putative transcriptional regulator [Pseudonocardia asaccharolytica]GEL18783.1 SARP family transcriptional regulator [Pseudonocardia asaccharolytica DSM 44247 = NBRC 16224]